MKEGAPIRFLLVALPAGLLLLGLLAMFGSHFRSEEKPIDRNEAIRLEAAALNRRPVNRDDLAKSLETLANRIGERHPGKPESLESAALWIESTLGGGNIGYTVERQNYDAGGVEARNLIAELPGRGRRSEIIVVGAHYDTVPGSTGANDNGTGISALISLARAFAGDPQERTIRFVAFANGATPELEAETRGSLVYAKRCQARGEKIIVMLEMDSLGDLYEGDAISIVGDEDSYYFVDSALVAFSRVSPIPVQGAASPGHQAPRVSSDHRSFSEAGFPAVAVFAKKVPQAPPSDVTADRLGAVDLETLEGSTFGIEAVLRAWANP